MFHFTINKQFLIGLLLISCLSLFVVPCFAAGRTISGIVSDESGSPVPGTNIRLDNESEQQIATTMTDQSGAFLFSNVPVERVFVRVQESQFAPVRMEIQAGNVDITNFQITLRLAEVKESVVVSVTRSERSLVDQPASVSLISEEQMEQTPANSMDDVLRTVPSMNLPFASSYQIHPTANSVSLRGLGGIRALVLLDGIPINDPFFGYLQWSRVSMDSVARVEIVRGGGSPLWGNYAMGGVINIITRPPDKSDFRFEGAYGRFDTYRGNGIADFIVNNSLKFRAEFSSWGTNGFKQVADDAGPIYVPTTFDAQNAALNAYFTPGTEWHGSLNFNFHDNDQNLLTPLSTNDQQIYDLAGNVVKNFDHSDLTISGFYEHSHFVTDNVGTPDGVEIGFGEFLQNHHTTPVDSTGASANWSMPMDGVIRLVTVGSDVQLISGEDRADIFDESGTQIRTDIGRGKQFFLGGFGQVDIFPSDNFEILASARIQNVRNFDGFDGVGGLGDVPDKSDNSFDPRVSVHYNIAPQFALRSAAYTSFRAPNLDNLYRSFSVPFGIFEPNAQLSPEKLKGGEVGFDVYQSFLSFQFTAYISEIEDLITSRNLDFSELPPGFFFGTRNINAGKARAQGVEAAADLTITSGWNAHFGYAYMDSHIIENELDPASVGKQQGGIPRQQIEGSIAYRSADKWRASTRMRWVDDAWGDNANTLPIPSHFVTDFSVAFKVAKPVELFLDIQNLFDEEYIADNSGFSPPLLGTPRSAIGGVRISVN